MFVCKCVLYYCHRVATQLQLNISYHNSEAPNLNHNWVHRLIKSTLNTVQACNHQFVSSSAILTRKDQNTKHSFACCFLLAWNMVFLYLPLSLRMCYQRMGREQGRLVHKGTRAAAVPQIMRKIIKLIIIKKFSLGNTYILYKNVNYIIFNWNNLDGRSAAERERAVPYPDVACWFSTARANSRKRGAARSRTELQAVLTFSHVSDAGILTTIFT